MLALLLQARTYRKKRDKSVLKKIPKTIRQLTGHFRKFYFTSTRLICVPQNKQCHQKISIYLNIFRLYRSFTGKHQHLETRYVGDIRWIRRRAPIPVLLFIIVTPATRAVPTRWAICRSFQNNTFDSAPSITRYHKRIGCLVRSFRIYWLSH